MNHFLVASAAMKYMQKWMDAIPWLMPLCCKVNVQSINYFVS
jgi:hypothetical protein